MEQGMRQATQLKQTEEGIRGLKDVDLGLQQQVGHLQQQTTDLRGQHTTLREEAELKIRQQDEVIAETEQEQQQQAGRLGRVEAESQQVAAEHLLQGVSIGEHGAAIAETEQAQQDLQQSINLQSQEQAQDRENLRQQQQALRQEHERATEELKMAMASERQQQTRQHETATAGTQILTEVQEQQGETIKDTRGIAEALRQQSQIHSEHIAALQAERGGGGASPQYDTQIAELQRKMGAENEAHLGRAQHLARHLEDNTELLETAQSDIESHQESLRGLGTGLRDLEHMAANRQAAVDRANRELSEQQQQLASGITASHQELAGEMQGLRDEMARSPSAAVARAAVAGAAAARDILSNPPGKSKKRGGAASTVSSLQLYTGIGAFQPNEPPTETPAGGMSAVPAASAAAAKSAQKKPSKKGKTG
eukprot:SAG22_NODE_540_length_9301_cov_422.312758_8_plen_424_part_00